MDAFISQIGWFACTFAPAEWAFCMGQTLPISQYTALFALIGDYFGGDARTTVGLPDLRGRSPMGSTVLGNPVPPLVGLPQGYRYGQQVRTLSLSQMPIHNHSATFTSTGSSGGTANVDVQIKANSDNATTHAAGENDPGGTAALSMAAPISGLATVNGYNALTPNVELSGIEASGSVSGVTVNGTVSIVNSGSSQDFSILNPIQALNACINLEGIFPTRN